MIVRQANVNNGMTTTAPRGGRFQYNRDASDVPPRMAMTNA